jgi:hypothetical protein
MTTVEANLVGPVNRCAGVGVFDPSILKAELPIRHPRSVILFQPRSCLPPFGPFTPARAGSFFDHNGHLALEGQLRKQAAQSRQAERSS